MEFGREFVEYLSELIDPNEIQYIVINHTEPDHSGGMAALAEEHRMQRLFVQRLL